MRGCLTNELSRFRPTWQCPSLSFERRDRRAVPFKSDPFVMTARGKDLVREAEKTLHIVWGNSSWNCSFTVHFISTQAETRSQRQNEWAKCYVGRIHSFLFESGRQVFFEVIFAVTSRLILIGQAPSIGSLHYFVRSAEWQHSTSQQVEI